jgi:lipopolysaccharide transport system permease protein
MQPIIDYMWITEYRDLIEILTISDLRVKYQSSVLGFAWSLINPLFTLLILYVVFSRIYQMSESQFVLFLFVGIVTWRFLANGTTRGMASIVTNPGLVKNIYIPRQVLVFSSVLSSSISSILEFVVLFCILLIVKVQFSLTMLLFPLIFLLFFIIVYALSLGLASLYVYYRDLNQVWEVLLQAGFFLVPIVYPISVIPEQYLAIYLLNPITVIIEIFRDILIYGKVPPPMYIAYTAVIAVILLVAGQLLFKKLERRFAEVV